MLGCLTRWTRCGRLPPLGFGNTTKNDRMMPWEACPPRYFASACLPVSTLFLNCLLDGEAYGHGNVPRKNDVTTEDEAQRDLKSLVRRVTAAFFVPPDGDEVLSAFSKQTNFLQTPFREIAEAFRSNIIGLLTTVSFPYVLVHRAAVGMHFQVIS